MSTNQQQQALDYFRQHADDWKLKAAGLKGPKVNVIEQRNQFVLDVASERAMVRSFLDAGCGSGELVCEMARRGIPSTEWTIPEMIVWPNASEQSLQHARFDCGSVLDCRIPPATLDLVSANGFIEYISHQQLGAFVDLVAAALAPGGSFVVGSRNRLFNLAAMNDYTLQESSCPDMPLLVRESVHWAKAAEGAALEPGECAPLQDQAATHGSTGIDGDTLPVHAISADGLCRRGPQTVEVTLHIHEDTCLQAGYPEVHVLPPTCCKPERWHENWLLLNASHLHVTRPQRRIDVRRAHHCMYHHVRTCAFDFRKSRTVHRRI